MENKMSVITNEIEALAAYLSCDIADIDEERCDHWGMRRFTVGSTEYAVADDDTADCALDRALDNYIYECILPEIPESFRPYFDKEKWKSDSRIDGRGKEEKIEGDQTYYIYLLKC